MTAMKEWGNKEILKLNLPEKIIIEALSLHSGYSKEKIKDLLRKTGDIGDMAYIVCKNKIQKQLGI